MKLIYAVLAFVMFLVVMPGLSSCSGVEEVPVVDDDVQERVMFRLTVGDTAPTSRTPSGDYDSGEGYENYIDVDSRNFRFYFFDSNNRYIAPLDVASVEPMWTTSSSKTYLIYSFAMDEAFTEPVKIVALANWPSYPDEADLVKGETTIADIVSAQYTFDASKMQLSKDNPIPLYGVTNAKTLTYDASNTADIGVIHMLRAYAKVEISIDPDTEFPVEWVKLVRYNTSGYCAPANIFSESHYVWNDYDKDYVPVPTVPKGVETTDRLPLIKVDDLKWMIYMPEYKNVGRVDSEKSRIEIMFAGDGDNEPATLYFATYNAAVSPNLPVKHFDLLRNYYYKFTVKRLKNEFTVNFALVPFAGVDLNPDFGMDNDNQYIPQIDKETGWNLIYDKDANLVGIYNDEYDLYYTCEHAPLTDPEPVGQARYKVYFDSNKGRIHIGYYELYSGSFFDEQGRDISCTPNGWAIWNDDNDFIREMNDPILNMRYQVEYDYNQEIGWVTIYIHRDLTDEGTFIAYYDVRERQFYDRFEQPVHYDAHLGYQCYIGNSGEVEILHDPVSNKWYRYDANGDLYEVSDPHGVNSTVVVL